VERIAGALSFDLVHAHDWMTVPAAIRVAQASGRPLVLHVHSCEHDRCGEGGDARIVEVEQAGLDAAARVVCVSRFTADVLGRHYRLDPSRVRVVHNGVDAPSRTRPLPGPGRGGEPLVLFLGRVTFQKGPDYFLEAAERIHRVMPGVRFVISGSGDMLPPLIESAARRGLARSVSFTGFLRGEDVGRMYSMASVYVMPSVSEPFGITPLEAAALGVPVVISRQSGVSEVLRHALRADFWDVQDIADKVLALLRHPVLARGLGEGGRGEVSRMRWEARGALLRSVYEELIP
jgi:glycosyltransferase involved in cell wall biosynthesis